jgi:hypothetical protein
MSMLTKWLAAAFFLCIAAPVPAADRPDNPASVDRYLVAQNDGPSLNEAVEQVRRQYNGRIVSAETRMNGNREMHYIKVLTEDGKVKTVRIPGRTQRS